MDSKSATWGICFLCASAACLLTGHFGLALLGFTITTAGLSIADGDKK